jgi:N-carbamoylputrescine amidase
MHFKTSLVINIFAIKAAELKIVLPLSFFERAHNVYYNSVIVIDTDGSM